MSYADFIKDPISQKNILVEIDIGTPHDRWLTYEPALFQWDYTTFRKDVTFNFMNGSFCYGAFKEGGVGDIGEGQIIYRMNSIIVSGITYAKVSDIATLRSTHRTFMYSSTDQIIYIHFDGGLRPESFAGQIIVGTTSAFCSNIPGVYDNVFYEARVISVPSLSSEVDPLLFGLVAFESGSIVLDNIDGAFDDFATKDVFGAPVRIKLGGKDLAYSNYADMLDSYIENFVINEAAITINIVDRRKALSRTININRFEIATYPDISDKNVNKPLPLAYGVLRDIPVICTNEEDVTPFEFKICDTANYPITSIDQVYVDGEEKAHGNENLVNATFTLTDAQYSPGNKVTADIDGYNIDNALEVFKSLIVDFTDAIYTDDWFDTEEWAIATALVEEISLFIDESTIIDEIEKICATVQGYFRVKGDGKFTFRLADTSAVAVKTISKEEILGQIVADYRSDEYASSMKVKYNKAYASDEHSRIVDDSKEGDLYAIYQIRIEKELETLLLTSTTATALAAELMERFGGVVPTFLISTKTQNADLIILDPVNVELDRVKKSWFGTLKCEVLGVSINLDSNAVDLTLRYIEDGTFIEYHFLVEENEDFFVDEDNNYIVVRVE